MLYLLYINKFIATFRSESAPDHAKDTPDELDRLPPGYYTFPPKRSESPPPGEHIPGEPQTPNMTSVIARYCRNKACHNQSLYSIL